MTRQRRRKCLPAADCGVLSLFILLTSWRVDQGDDLSLVGDEMLLAQPSDNDNSECLSGRFVVPHLNARFKLGDGGGDAAQGQLQALEVGAAGGRPLRQPFRQRG
jgi:hypothetical protein